MATIAMTVTNGYLDILRGATFGGESDRILYFAIGTGSTAPTINDTKLVSEAYRTIFSSFPAGSSHGEQHLVGLVDLSFANGVAIAEVGLVASSSTNTATSAANSGVLIARGLWSHTKQSTETITIDFDLTFKAG